MLAFYYNNRTLKGKGRQYEKRNRRNTKSYFHTCYGWLCFICCTLSYFNVMIGSPTKERKEKKMKKTLDHLIQCWYNLTSNTKTKKVITMAYTETMIAKITAAAPLDLAKSHALAAEFGDVSYRSVISKAKSLGLEYIAKAPAAKKAKSNEPTKAAILLDIRSALALPDREGDLTKAELESILKSLA